MVNHSILIILKSFIFTFYFHVLKKKILASKFGNEEIVILLLEKNADINKQNYDGETALICGIFESKYSFIVNLKKNKF